MVLPDKLSRFYPDLQRRELASSAIVFHQRFSTNTLPRWPLAHPFRMLAHNGEINTIEGNRRWAQARSSVEDAALRHRRIRPGDLHARLGLAEPGQHAGTDGRRWHGADPGAAHPGAAGHPVAGVQDPDLAAFYEFHGLNSEPWDGPAGIVACDSRYAVCTLDRNGLRPARWMLTADRHFLVASEAGVWEVPTERVVRKGKLGPGEMIAIDLKRGDLLDSDAVDRINRGRAPYKQWLQQGVTYLQTELIDPSLVEEPFDEATLRSYHKLYQLSSEEVEQVLRPLAETEQEATGSMGDDTPMAVLSQRSRPLYDYFRQAFAQVTNPPIDLREDCAMSLSTQLGKETNIFHAGPETVNHVILNSPVLSQRKLRQLLKMEQYVQANRLLDLSHSEDEGLVPRIERICAEAEQAARDGMVMLLLSDRYPVAGRPMVHALLATSAIHHHLSRLGLRCDVNLIVETGTARDPHHMALPARLRRHGGVSVPGLPDPVRPGPSRHPQAQQGGEQSQIGRRYRKGVYKGLSKIISKMGICTVASYRGAQLFEIIGLEPEVVDLCFPDTASRIGGAGFARLDADARELCAAWDAQDVDVGGLLKYVHGGEYHMYNPDVVTTLQRAARSGDPRAWQQYCDAMHARPPSALRDLLELVPAATPAPLDEVAPASELFPRFDTAAISLGALSPEAHEALAIAMNRLGAAAIPAKAVKTRTLWHRQAQQDQAGGLRALGVTAEYLVNAEVLQIKVAQGAKPGEVASCPGTRSTN